MQEYSLLLGSFGLFFLLAATMFLTRKINWQNK
ncbi:MAG TPA: inner membrane CreD family protein [Spirochaetota bacterium]|nr:inner membrane CreD family protein [Spirochaetota bacterium]